VTRVYRERERERESVANVLDKVAKRIAKNTHTDRNKLTWWQDQWHG
jgi:hypothetical protein